MLAISSTKFTSEMNASSSSNITFANEETFYTMNLHELLVKVLFDNFVWFFKRCKTKYDQKEKVLCTKIRAKAHKFESLLKAKCNII